MSINLDNLSQAGQAGGRTDRRHPNARQDRWLLELEQAMFAQARSKPAQHDGGAAAPLAPAAAAPAPEAPAVPATSGMAAPSAAGAHAVDTGARGAAAAAVAAAPHAGNAVHVPAAVAKEAPASAAPTAGAVSRPGQTDRAPMPSPRPDAAHTAQPASVAALAGAPYGLLARQAQPSSAAEADIGVRQAARADATVPTWQGGQKSMARGAPAQQEAAALDLPPAQPQPGAEGEEAATAGAPHASDDEYGLRNLHVYRDGEAVQAWLRDSRIGPAQAQAVAQAVAAELAGEGAQLRALTVNGKPVAVRAARGERDQDSFADSPAASASEDNVKGKY